MLVDPQFSAEPVSAVLQWLRELAVIGAIIVFGWHARSAFQYVKDFTTEIREHIKRMDAFVIRVESNHLRHIEDYLYRLAKDRNITAVVDPGYIAMNHETTDKLEPPDSIEA
jgi:hypothetical protein